MSRIVFAGSVAICVLGGFLAIAASPPPTKVVDFEPWLVYQSLPEKLIEHDVDWKGVFDSDRKQSLLVGPRLFSIASSSATQRSAEILFGWYEIAHRPDPQRAQVSVWFDDGTKREYTVGEASYFLSKTQLLDTGTPAAAPESLGHYAAYRILGHSESPRDLTLSTKEGVADYELQKPAFLCLPVEEWHHHQHFPASTTTTCWVVYDVSPAKHSDSLTTLDQFGLNKLKLQSANWLCVPAPRFRISARDP